MTGRLPPMPTISDIIRLFKLRSQKKLSQNFLLDMNLTRKIVKCAGNIEGGYVCEVGPGPGGITRAILEKDVKQLNVIEKDQRFIPSLQILSDACDHKLKIYHGDVLDFDMEKLFTEAESQEWDKKSPNIHIIGNLPFNISTPLIIKYLEAISNRTGPWKYGRTKMTLTFQKEVAERMVATILNKRRSRLSIMCQHLCETHLKFVIPGTAFVPVPMIDVGVVHFVPLRTPMISQPFKIVEKVVGHVFHYRQKMIKHSIQTLFPLDMPELLEKMFAETCIDPETRPIQLSIEEFGRLCHVYAHICEQHPHIFDYDYRSKESLNEIKQFRLNRRLSRMHELQQELEKAEKDVTDKKSKFT